MQGSSSSLPNSMLGRVRDRSQIHLMQQEVIAQNNECARIPDQSRQAQAAARHVHDIQEDKIKTLSDLDERVARLDQEARHRRRLEEQNAS